ncbi:MAG: GlsB/YeaQ/YmgE family stress response membrane protein [Verrucomicrobiaceae bacterium]|nr:GlsB/YeaQ/YmgE family stress response membrane protein [Verrucomicrobiaceae bacterium]
MNGLVAWMGMGLIAGVLAKFLMPGRDGGGFIMTILLGVLGALLGGWIGTKAGIGTVHDFSLQSIGIATAGSIALLVVRRFMLK